MYISAFFSIFQSFKTYYFEKSIVFFLQRIRSVQWFFGEYVFALPESKKKDTQLFFRATAVDVEYSNRKVRLFNFQ